VVDVAIALGRDPPFVAKASVQSSHLSAQRFQL
jgi:hypothetical protein